MSDKLPICPRCQEETAREAGASGLEMERVPTHMTKTGRVIPGKDVAVRKRLYRCLKCGRTWAVPEKAAKKKVIRGRTKTAGRKRRKAGKPTRSVSNAK